MTRQWLCVLIGLATLVVTTAAGAGDDAKSQIRALQEQWVEAVHAGDVDTIVGFYAEDAHFLPQGSPALQGTAAIREWWEKTLAEQDLSTLTFGPSHIAVTPGDELIYEIGTSEQRVTDGDETEIRHGKYLVVWKRVDGQWRVAVDMFNSN